MREGTDLNQLVFSQKIQRNRKRALGWRQAGGIVALKMVLCSMCSFRCFGKGEISPLSPLDRLGCNFGFLFILDPLKWQHLGQGPASLMSELCAGEEPRGDS